MAGSALLRSILNEVRDKKILAPIIRSTLHDPNFKGFTLEVEGWTPRPYDGWLHPSGQATWEVEELVRYLTEPESFSEEEPTLSFVLSVTQGKFWHTFIQRLLLDNGILVQDEVPLRDPLHRRRGHTDGLLSTGELLEIKTASARMIRKLTTATDLRTAKPEYYAQTQDYLDMAQVEHMRYLVMGMEAPFEIAEYIISADSMYQARQRLKYREAIDIAAEIMADREPLPISPLPESRLSLRWGVALH